MPAGVINDSDHSTYRALSAFCDRGGNCGTERLTDFLSEAQPGGWSGPWVLPADPSRLSRPRIMAQPCVACVKTPWKDCSFCFSSPSCLLGPWPLSSAACPEPGPSSHPVTTMRTQMMMTLSTLRNPSASCSGSHQSEPFFQSRLEPGLHLCSFPGCRRRPH